jgi:hypothetical protein
MGGNRCNVVIFCGLALSCVNSLSPRRQATRLSRGATSPRRCRQLAASTADEQASNLAELDLNRLAKTRRNALPAIGIRRHHYRGKIGAGVAGVPAW